MLWTTPHHSIVHAVGVVVVVVVVLDDVIFFCVIFLESLFGGSLVF